MPHLPLFAVAAIEWHGSEAVLDDPELVEQRPGKVSAEVDHRALDARPHIPFRYLDQPPAVLGERDDFSALVVRRPFHLEQAKFDKLCQGPRGARLRDPDRVRQLPDRERPQPIDRGEERVLEWTDYIGDSFLAAGRTGDGLARDWHHGRTASVHRVVA